MFEEKNYCIPIEGSEFEGWCTAKDHVKCKYSILEFASHNQCQECSEKKYLYKNKMTKKCLSLEAIRDKKDV